MFGGLIPFGSHQHGWLCFGPSCDPGDLGISSGSTSSRNSEHPSAPAPTSHTPSTTTTRPVSPQETQSPSTANSQTSEKPSLGSVPTSNMTSYTIPTSNATHLADDSPTQSSQPSISALNTPGPSSTNGTLPLITSTNPSLSSSVVQLPTIALAPSSRVVEPTSSHTGANPRIIVPVVLIVVILAVGCVIIWLKKIKGRRTSPGKETLESTEAQMEGAGGATRVRLEERSNEKSGRLIRDMEDTLEPESVEGKARGDIGRGEDDWDGQAEVLSRRDGGYGWGLGKQDDKLRGLEEQGDMHEPAPAYSRDPY